MIYPVEYAKEDYIWNYKSYQQGLNLELSTDHYMIAFGLQYDQWNFITNIPGYHTFADSSKITGTDFYTHPDSSVVTRYSKTQPDGSIIWFPIYKYFNTTDTIYHYAEDSVLQYKPENLFYSYLKIPVTAYYIFPINKKLKFYGNVELAYAQKLMVKNSPEIQLVDAKALRANNYCVSYSVGMGISYKILKGMELYSYGSLEENLFESGTWKTFKDPVKINFGIGFRAFIKESQTRKIKTPSIGAP